MAETIGTLSSVMIQVKEMDEACAFYGDVLGFKLKFRDGDRWAAFDAGGITLALAGEGERPSQVVTENVALNIKVADTAYAMERSLWGGARLLEEPKTTSHEIRATVQDPSGRIINFYTPRSR